MISCDKGKIQLKGDVLEVVVELEFIVESIAKQMFEHNNDIEMVSFLLSEVFANGVADAYGEYQKTEETKALDKMAMVKKYFERKENE